MIEKIMLDDKEYQYRQVIVPGNIRIRDLAEQLDEDGFDADRPIYYSYVPDTWNKFVFFQADSEEFYEKTLHPPGGDTTPKFPNLPTPPFYFWDDLPYWRSRYEVHKALTKDCFVLVSDSHSCRFRQFS
jgi:hypothetical protein